MKKDAEDRAKHDALRDYDFNGISDVRKKQGHQNDDNSQLANCRDTLKSSPQKMSFMSPKAKR